MENELQIIKVIIEHDRPTVPTIASITGLSRATIGRVITNLNRVYKMKIVYEGSPRHGKYVIRGWGLFETGEKIREEAIEFVADKQNK